MSFGSPTPIEIVVASPNIPDAIKHADRSVAEMQKIPCLRDVQFHESLAYPSVEIDIDREKAGLSGVTAQQVGNAAIVATSSSRFIALNYWQNPKTGFDYQVEVLVPTQQMTSSDQVATLPIEQVTNAVEPDGARRGRRSRRNDDGADRPHRLAALRRASRPMSKAKIWAAPRGRCRQRSRPPARRRAVSACMTRGQFPPMVEMFKGLGIGLCIAVVVILILLTAYFESPRLAIISISAVPGVLSGSRDDLVGQRHDAEHGIVHGHDHVHRRLGVELRDAGDLHRTNIGAAAMPTRRRPPRSGAAERLRPIIMTACAMTVGMVPMSLALEAGSQMQAPLGRAVIGGLVCRPLPRCWSCRRFLWS